MLTDDARHGHRQETAGLAQEAARMTAVRLRRTDVIRRLHERGVPLRALEALLPGWEDAIAAVAPHAGAVTRS